MTIKQRIKNALVAWLLPEISTRISELETRLTNIQQEEKKQHIRTLTSAIEASAKMVSESRKRGDIALQAFIAELTVAVSE